MSATLLHAGALVWYIFAGIFYGANLTIKAPAHTERARIFFLVAVAVHTLAIGAHCMLTRQSPFASASGTLSVAAWALALIFLPIEFRSRMPSLGALAAPFCCLLLFGALATSNASMAATAEMRRGIVSVHVLLIVFSFAFFALAACCAVLYVWQYGLLKRHHNGGQFKKLPPLEKVDSLAYHLVAFALPMLTIGLALGIMRATSLHNNWIVDPKTIVSIVLWAVYCIYLSARTIGGWRGTRLNYLLIAGLVVTLALYFVPSATHRFS
jgi:HemX protein